MEAILDAIPTDSLATLVRRARGVWNLHEGHKSLGREGTDEIMSTLEAIADAIGHLLTTTLHYGGAEYLVLGTGAMRTGETCIGAQNIRTGVIRTVSETSLRDYNLWSARRS